nr:hypothetical protein [Tanacetum cinerariifolium]
MCSYQGIFGLIVSSRDRFVFIDKPPIDVRKDEEDVSSNDVIVQAKVLMALAEDEQLDVGENHVKNGKLNDITMRK